MRTELQKKKAAEARQRWEERFADALRNYAEDPDAADEVLDVALRWLTLSLKQRKEFGKRDAPKLYKHAAEEIAKYAKYLNELTEKGK
ncbi:MAG TPA: hypothetical protein VGG75_16025 [Trebonia sp.]|jgi:hypothetical protein